MSDLYEDTPEGEPKAPKPRRRLIDGELRGAYLPIRDHRRQQAAANREQCHCCTLDSPVINYTLRYPDDRSWANATPVCPRWRLWM
jgi:hypothetical protein